MTDTATTAGPEELSAAPRVHGLSRWVPGVHAARTYRAGWFPRDLVAQYFGGDNAAPTVPVESILALGAETYDGGDPGVFNMAVMGFRLAQRANGVAKLHGDVSRHMFNALWPGFDAGEVPIGSITNGVHAPTWTARELIEHGYQSTRQGDPEDGRMASLSLTPRGSELFEACAPRHLTNAQGLLEGLSERERDQLGRLLDKLLFSLEGPSLPADRRTSSWRMARPPEVPAARLRKA